MPRMGSFMWIPKKKLILGTLSRNNEKEKYFQFDVPL